MIPKKGDEEARDTKLVNENRLPDSDLENVSKILNSSEISVNQKKIVI